MDKKFMNKMDDMELDMVAGGGFFDILKEGTKQIVNPVAKTFGKLIEAEIDAMKEYGIVLKLIGKLCKNV
ncbi:MAG: hypothetical protein E7203_00515 [Selenomonas ruminantium]|jgi:hypothetical protein|uniref:Uncharacterized protein n=1 Tax=Selenomonas ruminantium TaxID=971 RepID=A0A927ZXX5_SELRU|nr:hypothetical protein [Selenomonas ruminantium]MBE6083953.1 hypothetical protein [Selenomonas ruminantium]